MMLFGKIKTITSSVSRLELKLNSESEAEINPTHPETDRKTDGKLTQLNLIGRVVQKQ